jgi:hypothetical protein
MSICSMLAFGDAGRPDLPHGEQFGERADRLLVGHLRVGPVELVEADGVHAERLQRRLRRGPHVGCPAGCPGRRGPGERT